jgi:hypothetical protein
LKRAESPLYSFRKAAIGKRSPFAQNLPVENGLWKTCQAPFGVNPIFFNNIRMEKG